MQQVLQKIYNKPLLVNRVNMPGADKDTPLARHIFNAMETVLRRHFKHQILTEKLLLSAEGPVMIRVVDLSSEEIKAVAITIENEARLGRFVDLDVYGLNGEGLSRTALGYESRTCYLCSAPAQECVRSQRHKQEELLTFMAAEVFNNNKNV